MTIINKKIYELYNSKAHFCEKNGYKYKDFASKLRTLQKKINWVNKFLEPLNLEIVIKEKT